jgi:hypothetical protein
LPTDLPIAQRKRRASAGLYFVGVGLIGCALAIALTGYSQGTDAVRGLQRAEMPGRAEVTLAAGRTTVYLEGDGQIRCAMVDNAGNDVGLRAATGKVRYSFGGRRGRNGFDVDIMAPGTYVVTCTGDAMTIAVGGGIGAWLVVAIVGGLVPGMAGIGLCLFVFIARRRYARRSHQGS